MIGKIVLVINSLLFFCGCSFFSSSTDFKFDVKAYPLSGAILLAQDSILISYKSNEDFDSVVVVINGDRIKMNNEQLHYDLNGQYGVISYLVEFHKNRNSKMIRRRLINRPPAPEIEKINIVKKIKREGAPHTQGFTIDDGVIYESSGEYGKSYVHKVDLESMRPIRDVKLDSKYFGEGCAVLGDSLYVLTWQEGILFKYNKLTLELEEAYPIMTDGWGLTTDGEFFYLSDGSSYIYKLSTDKFEILDKIEVITNNGALNYINELEWIDGYIYANCFTTDYIAKIDPKSGVVIKFYDASGLWELKPENYGEDVLNGIAYDINTKKTYITGKKWDVVYEVKF